jgi:hypothetical protein
MVEINGHAAIGPIRMGIPPAGRTIGPGIGPIGLAIIGRIIIGPRRWAAAGVLNAPTSTRTVNDTPNPHPTL